ncbi:MAG: HIT family protein [Candidatus Dormibacteraceae bacterium]
MTYDPNCEFCRIVHRLEGARIVCETDVALAFFPLKPAALGHTLVVPKEHVSDLLNIDEALAEQLMALTVRVARAIDHALHPDGMNLISSVGEVASQSVFHLHLHLVPRWKGDHIPNIWPPPQPWPEAAKDDVAQLIRDACYEV